MSKTDAAWISSTLRVKKLGGVKLADLSIVSSCMLQLNCIIVEKQYGSKQSFSQPILMKIASKKQLEFVHAEIHDFRTGAVLFCFGLIILCVYFLNCSSVKCQQFPRPLSTYPQGIQRCRRPSFLSLKQCYFKVCKVRL